MLLDVKVEGMSAYADVLRFEPGHYGNGGSIVLLSMFGPRNAVRAAWARLSESTRKGRHSTSIAVGEFHVSKGEASYTTISSPLPGRGLTHTVIVHQQLQRNAPDIGFFYQVGPDADRRYYDRLARYCAVPLRRDWSAALWSLGITAGTVSPVVGHGLEVFRISTDADAWAALVKNAIVSGLLS